MELCGAALEQGGEQFAEVAVDLLEGGEEALAAGAVDPPDRLADVVDRLLQVGALAGEEGEARGELLVLGDRRQVHRADAVDLGGELGDLTRHLRQLHRHPLGLRARDLRCALVAVLEADARLVARVAQLCRLLLGAIKALLLRLALAGEPVLAIGEGGDRLFHRRHPLDRALQIGARRRFRRQPCGQLPLQAQDARAPLRLLAIEGGGALALGGALDSTAPLLFTNRAQLALQVMQPPLRLAHRHLRRHHRLAHLLQACLGRRQPLLALTDPGGGRGRLLLAASHLNPQVGSLRLHRRPTTGETRRLPAVVLAPLGETRLLRLHGLLVVARGLEGKVGIVGGAGRAPKLDLGAGDRRGHLGHLLIRRCQRRTRPG